MYYYKHWQYNVIVTQTTGAIKYSVSDSVEEKDITMNRKKLPVHVWSVCEELAIIHKESRNSTNKQLLWIYQYYTNLTKIEAIVNYGMCSYT